MTKLQKYLLALFIVCLLPLFAFAAVYFRVIRSTSLSLPISEETTSEVFRLEPVLSGLSQPTYVTHAGDASNRLFITEQRGRIRVIEDGTLRPEPFLDITSKVANMNWEQGLLSVAFHPQYKDNGRFFIYYVAAEDGRSVIAEYQVSSDPNRANEEERIVLESPNNSGLERGVHYGGQLQFGPDGYLYISLGDGYQRPELAPGNVPKPSQDLTTLPGSILRIDIDQADPYGIPEDNPFVNTAGARPEIWAYGLRNPWRFSFDRKTGEIFTGDVGFVGAEEINIVKAGHNYGWPVTEGDACYVASLQGRVGCYLRALRGGYQDPIAYYSRFNNDTVTEGKTDGNMGGNSVTGGYVYRGERFPNLQGQFFAADFIFGNIWTLKKGTGKSWEVTDSVKTLYQISSFGEDETGELYALEWGTGTLYSVVE